MKILISPAKSLDYKSPPPTADAVLGLGDIGPEASKPVMEGKGLLFKIFA